MRLTAHAHLVGSGEPGWALTDPLDSQVYLLDTGDGLAVVDCGTGRSVEGILDAVRSDGFDHRAIRWLLLTHAHADHAGGAGAWRRSVPGLEVLASEDVATWLRGADEEATSVDRARKAGMYPADFHLEPADVEGIAHGVATLRLGGIELAVIPTPGHAAGHLAFAAQIDGKLTLFSGDALFPDGRILLQDTWDCDLHAALRSVEALGSLGAQRLFAGHGRPVLEDAHAHVEPALSRIGRLLVPESLV